MIYITGDTHGKFERIKYLCENNSTTKKDILIILGDAGINYHRNDYDYQNKKYLKSLPITIFSIHGNHEIRPTNISTYKEKKWNGGVVYYEEEFPSLLFAKDGEFYDFDGLKTLVIGGAYSVDKMYRIIYGYGWWEDEQPSLEIKKYVEQQLEENNWEVDIVLTHTTPFKYEPVEVFLEGIDQSTVDKTTEKWLDVIEKRLKYKKWYCGHYHTEKEIDNIRFMFQSIDKFVN